MSTPSLESTSNNNSTDTITATASSLVQQGVHLPADLVTQLSVCLSTHLKEQHSTRRWRMGFRYTVLVLFFLALLVSLFRSSSNTAANQAHVALIKLEGTIEYGSPAAAEPMMAALQAAFDDTASVAVVVQLNSPGGSPVQADIIYNEIFRLREKYPEKPIYGVIEEVCASGCYYIASAMDSLYANGASMVGSIGVIMDSFGAVDLMKKLGVERRIYTAGTNKNLLDPFSPTSAKQLSIIKDMLSDVHSQFINAVKNGRGELLKDDGELFSGRIYSGNQGLAVGLIDDIGNLNEVTREVIGNENLIDYSPKENLAERVAKRFGASFGGSFGASIGSSSLKATQTTALK
jgi:protease IV